MSSPSPLLLAKTFASPPLPMRLLLEPGPSRIPVPLAPVAPSSLTPSQSLRALNLGVPTTLMPVSAPVIANPSTWTASVFSTTRAGPDGPGPSRPTQGRRTSATTHSPSMLTTPTIVGRLEPRGGGPPIPPSKGASLKPIVSSPSRAFDSSSAARSVHSSLAVRQDSSPGTASVSSAVLLTSNDSAAATAGRAKAQASAISAAANAPATPLPPASPHSTPRL